jgi:hypothetical protein
MGERHEGEHFSRLSEFQKRAIDDYIRAVLSDEAQIDFTRKRDASINIVHPDQYRDDMREFLASSPHDVQDIEARYKDIPTQLRGTEPSKDRGGRGR